MSAKIRWGVLGVAGIAVEKVIPAMQQGEFSEVAAIASRDAAKAADYVNAGYLWNSGNFMFPAAVLLDEYRKVDAGSVQVISEAVTNAGRDLGFVTLEPKAFGAAKAISWSC